MRSGDRILITRRGSECESLTAEDCVEVSLADCTLLHPVPDGVRPSSELPLHRSIYNAIEAGAIVHTHSHYATVLSTLVDEIPAIHYAVHAFGGPVRVAPYETFGTDELAASVIGALDGRTGALMANHGAVVSGNDIAAAASKAIALEWLASVYYHALVCGTPAILTDDQIDAVRHQIGRLRYDGEATTR